VASVTAPGQFKPSPSVNSVLWIVALWAAVIAAVFILKIPPLGHPWPQGYDPTGHWWLSTLLAALPVVVLIGTLALLHMKAHYAALLGLATSLVCAIWIFHMPGGMAAKTAVYGAIFGFLRIGWIILNVIFMYQLTCDAGLFKVLQESLTGITQDRRLQLLLIAFSFGAFFEGAAGFGTPVAVTAAILIGLGFRPDTSSNGLFGSLQRISAEQVGVSANLMAAANSCGGVMGKMIDAQSIVVASTAPSGMDTKATFCVMCSSTASRSRPWWELW
jgi:L-lactate permease